MIKIEDQGDTIGELRIDFEKEKEHIITKDKENAKLLESLRHQRDHRFRITSGCCDYLKKILFYWCYFG
jgi:hypothetical protein